MLKLEVSFKGLVVVGLALLSLWAVRQLWPVVLLIIAAVIFMTALLPVVEWMVRRKLPRGVAVLLVLVAVLLVLGGMVAIVAPAVVDEFRSVKTNLPDYARDVEQIAQDFGLNTDSWELERRATEVDWTSLISGQAAVGYGQQALVGVLSAFTVLVLTIYLLTDGPRLKRFFFRAAVPRGREAEAERVLQGLARVVGGFVRGQLITSAIIGVYTMTVLLILGVDNAVAFGVLAAFADVIPLIGAFIAILPPAVAGFQESPGTALAVMVALLAYQQFEDRFLVPRVYGKTLNLPALVVFLAVLVGGELLGITGVLLALPTAAAGRVFLDFYLENRDAQNGLPDTVSGAD